MGAVRRLATVVIIGLVALSTVMVVYLAAEPNRRGSETEEQDLTAIERGTSLYITYCLQCHGPAGLGAAGKDGRIGAILNQDAITPEEEQGGFNANFQSDDPVQQAIAEDWIRFRITYGYPAERPAGFDEPIVMPAFGNDLNVEEMNDLVYLIMNGDWNYVYNTVVHQTGVSEAEAACAEDKDGEYCDDPSKAPPAYPVLPTAAPEEGEATPAASAEAAPADGAEAAASIEAFDMGFTESQLTVKPGDTISFTNTGALEHDFVIDALGIEEYAEAGGPVVTITIPEDAEPGDYEFYCSIPGHKASGMVGTLTIEAP